MSTPHYHTKTETIKIDGVDDLVIRSLLDRQQFYDPKGAAARLGICSASWSLFGMLWPSSIRLASALALRPVNADEKILEIGCGLALASLVAHRRLISLPLIATLKLNYFCKKICVSTICLNCLFDMVNGASTQCHHSKTPAPSYSIQNMT